MVKRVAQPNPELYPQGFDFPEKHMHIPPGKYDIKESLEPEEEQMIVNTKTFLRLTHDLEYQKHQRKITERWLYFACFIVGFLVFAYFKLKWEL